MKFPKVILVLPIFILSIKCDNEYNDHVGSDQHYINGIHNSKFDSMAIIGSLNSNDDFSKLAAHDAKNLLKQHLKEKVDSNKDGYISENEIKHLIMKYFQKEDEKNAIEKSRYLDKNDDGKISLDEHYRTVFGYSVRDIENYKLDNSPDMISFNEMISDDETRFMNADQDNDGMLNMTEFSAFLNPNNYDFMHDAEINKTLKRLDKNQDGYLNFEEYLGESTPIGEQRIVDKENFKSYDIDNDGKLNRQELKSWILPDSKSMAEQEAIHLIQECDKDLDKRLSYEEILNNHELWVGSAATFYGEKLTHDASEL